MHVMATFTCIYNHFYVHGKLLSVYMSVVGHSFIYIYIYV